MRFTRLDLRAVGPFDGVELDLSAGDRGLHLIHGPNEAGKSSALRAVRDMLFGFEHQSKSAFDGDNGKLRVGATIRGEHGQELSFLRRKGIRRTLLEPAGRVAIDDSALAVYLGGMTPAAFDSLFALDHMRLREGGGQILRGGGDLGPLVFASGVDLRRLAVVRKAVESRHADLFKPRGENQAINRALTKLTEAREQVRAASLPWPSYQSKSKERDAKHQERLDLEARLTASRAAAERLKGLKRAQPDLALRRSLLEELRELQAVRPLSDDFASRRAAAETATSTATALDAQAGGELREVGRLRAEIAAPGPIVDEASAIERLHRGAKQHGEDRAAIDGRRREVGALADEIAAERDLLRLPAEADPRPSGLTITRLKTLVEALRDIEAECVSCSGAIERLSGEIAGLHGPAVDLSRLAEAIRGAHDAAGPAALHDNARSACSKAARRAGAALRELVPAPPPGVDVESLPIPAPEAIQRHQAALNDAQGHVELIEADIAKARAGLRIVAQDLVEARRWAVPTEAELVAARAGRDEAWGRLKGLLDGGVPLLSVGGLTAEIEAATGRADAIADSLRTEANRVNQRLASEAERDHLVSLIGEKEAELEAARSAAASASTAWSSQWSACGIEPSSPREMLAWAEKRQRYVELVDQLHDLEDGREQSGEIIRAASREVDSALAALGHPPRPEVSGLAERLRRAEAIHEELDVEAARRSRLDADLAEARRDEREALRLHKNWKGEWAKALGPLGIGPAAEGCKAADLLDWVQRRVAARGQIEGCAALETRLSTYKAEVAELCRGLAMDLADRPADDVIGALNRRLQEARRAQTMLEGLDARADAASSTSVAAAAEIVEQARRVAGLCAEAGCSSADQLPEVERLWAQRRAREADLSAVEARIREHAAGGSVEALAADAATVDRYELGPRIDDIEAEAVKLTDRQTTLAHQLGGLDAELGRMAETSGSGAAVDALDREEEIRGEMELDILKYVEAKLAAEVLDRAVKSYLDKNRGPILDRAGGLFARLTGGRFEGIDVEYDGENQALIGLRAPGRRHVGVDAMSQGTADQLYLALKLAGIGHHLDHHPPMPVLLDDILIHFDDERSTAALHALADLSRRTQVLLFTHHEHLVALAEDALDSQTLFVHRLCAAAPAAV